MAIQYDEYGNPYEDNVDPDAAEAEDKKKDVDARAAINARYQEYLGRPVESEAVMQAHLRNPGGIQGVGAAISASDEFKQRQANLPGPGTTPPKPPVSPVSTSTDLTSPSPVPRTATNPFGSNAVAPTDVGMSNMIEKDKAGWRQLLIDNWPKGLAFDEGAIDGVIRQLSYAANAGQDPKKFIDQAIATAKTRAQSGGDLSVAGNYNTNWNDLDPSRLGGRDPSAAYTTAMNNLQTQMDAPGTTTAQRNALRTQMAGMFNGAYAGPPPPVSTIGAITSSAPTAPAVPTNTAAAAPSPQPTTPYSARQAVPVMTAPPIQAAPVQAAMPATTTMANMMTPQNPYAAQTPYAAQNPYAAARQFGYTNDVYDRSLQGTGFAQAPWAGTRDQLARGPIAQSSMDTSTGMPSAADRRRAYRFGAQDAANNQRDATLGQQDFNGQMSNWLKAYNDWNQRGADPLAPPTGGV